MIISTTLLPMGQPARQRPNGYQSGMMLGQFKVGIPTHDDHVCRRSDHYSHMIDTGPHSSTSSPTANRIIRRDSNGRAQVAAPYSANDIARLNEITAEALARATADSDHAALEGAHNATHLNTANRIMRRDSYGRCRVSAPYNSDDCVRLTDLNSHVNNETDAHGAWAGTKANSIAKRDSSGRLQFSAGLNDYDGVNISQFTRYFTGDWGYLTLPGRNGKEIRFKFGKTLSGPGAVFFSTAFPNEIMGLVICFEHSTGAYPGVPIISSASISGFSWSANLWASSTKTPTLRYWACGY